MNKLIPDNEDFFSVISAIERLSKETNFVINQYTINLSESTPEKLSLAVTGDGNSETFLKLLENYNFVGGRLITLNTFDFNNKGVQYSLNFNFYHKGVPSQLSNLASIPAKDIQFMREVQSKVEFLLTSTGQAEESKPADYPTTTKLF